jgi:hypothetical protein
MFSMRSRLDPPELRQAMLMRGLRKTAGEVWNEAAAVMRPVVVTLQSRENGRVPRISGTRSFLFASVGVCNNDAGRRSGRCG